MRSSTLWVFDCDGVMVDSNEGKVSAMSDTLRDEGLPSSFVSLAATEFRSNFGRSRVSHLQAFSALAKRLGLNFNDEMKQTIMRQYGRRVQHIYRFCSVIPETIEFIKVCVNARQRLIVSASDQDELRQSLPSRTGLFHPEEIFGGPTSKRDNLKNIRQSDGFTHFIYVGDSVSDAIAASEAGFVFFGVSKYSADSEALIAFCNANDLVCYDHCCQLKEMQ